MFRIVGATLVALTAIGCGGGTNENTTAGSGTGSGTASSSSGNGAGGEGGAGGAGGAGGSIEPGQIVKPGRTSTEYVLNPSLHPHDVGLVLRVFFPDGSSLLDAGKTFPVAFGYHGSGGLHREPNTPGDECLAELETTYQEMTDFFLAQGIAVVWTDSFYSRDPRFCEDNTAEFQQYAPPVMDSNLQQVISRVYDTVIVESTLCTTGRFDCKRALRIGTSEGGTATLLPSHRYLDHSIAQLFDPNSPQNKLDKLTLLKYVPLPMNRPVMSFIFPISPGCGFQAAIPFSTTGDTKDLYYPDTPTYLEIGGNDSIPAECATAVGTGTRELQALEVQKRESITAADYRYHPTIYAGAGHSLWAEQKSALQPKLEMLIKTHLP